MTTAKRCVRSCPMPNSSPGTFQTNGYHSLGSGKLLHSFIDAPSWQSYFPEKSSENPLPKTTYPPKHPLNLPVGGPWQYLETDWGGLAKEWRDLRYKNGDVITLALGKSFGHQKRKLLEFVQAIPPVENAEVVLTHLS